MTAPCATACHEEAWNFIGELEYGGPNAKCASGRWIPISDRNSGTNCTQTGTCDAVTMHTKRCGTGTAIDATHMHTLAVEAEVGSITRVVV